jgi:hypothetical protein
VHGARNNISPFQIAIQPPLLQHHHNMAPPNSQKRVKGVQIYRPFVFGTVAKPFDPVTNPKPDGTPVDHTHSWTVFVKGVDDTDITYWLKKVQFKLHESIPNPLRSEQLPKASSTNISRSSSILTTNNHNSRRSRLRTTLLRLRNRLG